MVPEFKKYWVQRAICSFKMYINFLRWNSKTVIPSRSDPSHSPSFSNYLFWSGLGPFQSYFRVHTVKFKNRAGNSFWEISWVWMIHLNPILNSEAPPRKSLKDFSVKKSFRKSLSFWNEFIFTTNENQNRTFWI